MLTYFTGQLKTAGGAKFKVRGPPKSVGFILWGQKMSVQTVMAIHPVVVKITKAVDECLTNIAIHKAMQLVSLRTTDPTMIIAP